MLESLVCWRGFVNVMCVWEGAGRGWERGRHVSSPSFARLVVVLSGCCNVDSDVVPRKRTWLLPVVFLSTPSRPRVDNPKNVVC